MSGNRYPSLQHLDPNHPRNRTALAKIKGLTYRPVFDMFQWHELHPDAVIDITESAWEGRIEHTAIMRTNKDALPSEHKFDIDPKKVMLWLFQSGEPQGCRVAHQNPSTRTARLFASLVFKHENTDIAFNYFNLGLWDQGFAWLPEKVDPYDASSLCKFKNQELTGRVVKYLHESQAEVIGNEIFRQVNIIVTAKTDLQLDHAIQIINHLASMVPKKKHKELPRPFQSMVSFLTKLGPLGTPYSRTLLSTIATNAQGSSIDWVIIATHVFNMNLHGNKPIELKMEIADSYLEGMITLFGLGSSKRAPRKARDSFKQTIEKAKSNTPEALELLPYATLRLAQACAAIAENKEFKTEDSTDTSAQPEKIEDPLTLVKPLLTIKEYKKLDFAAHAELFTLLEKQSKSQPNARLMVLEQFKLEVELSNPCPVLLNQLVTFLTNNIDAFEEAGSTLERLCIHLANPDLHIMIPQLIECIALIIEKTRNGIYIAKVINHFFAPETGFCYQTTDNIRDRLIDMFLDSANLQTHFREQYCEILFQNYAIQVRLFKEDNLENTFLALGETLLLKEPEYFNRTFILITNKLQSLQNPSDQNILLQQLEALLTHRPQERVRYLQWLFAFYRRQGNFFKTAEVAAELSALEVKDLDPHVRRDYQTLAAAHQHYAAAEVKVNNKKSFTKELKDAEGLHQSTEQEILTKINTLKFIMTQALKHNNIQDALNALNIIIKIQNDCLADETDDLREAYSEAIKLVYNDRVVKDYPRELLNFATQSSIKGLPAKIRQRLKSIIQPILSLVFSENITFIQYASDGGEQKLPPNIQLKDFLHIRDRDHDDFENLTLRLLCQSVPFLRSPHSDAYQSVLDSLSTRLKRDLESQRKINFQQLFPKDMSIDATHRTLLKQLIELAIQTLTTKNSMGEYEINTLMHIYFVLLHQKLRGFDCTDMPLAELSYGFFHWLTKLFHVEHYRSGSFLTKQTGKDSLTALHRLLSHEHPTVRSDAQETMHKVSRCLCADERYTLAARANFPVAIMHLRKPVPEAKRGLFSPSRDLQVGVQLVYCAALIALTKDLGKTQQHFDLLHFEVIELQSKILEADSFLHKPTSHFEDLRKVLCNYVLQHAEGSFTPITEFIVLFSAQFPDVFQSALELGNEEEFRAFQAVASKILASTKSSKEEREKKDSERDYAGCTSPSAPPMDALSLSDQPPVVVPRLSSTQPLSEPAPAAVALSPSAPLADPTPALASVPALASLSPSTPPTNPTPVVLSSPSPALPVTPARVVVSSSAPPAAVVSLSASALSESAIAVLPSSSAPHIENKNNNPPDREEPEQPQQPIEGHPAIMQPSVSIVLPIASPSLAASPVVALPTAASPVAASPVVVSPAALSVATSPRLAQSQHSLSASPLDQKQQLILPKSAIKIHCSKGSFFKCRGIDTDQQHILRTLQDLMQSAAKISGDLVIRIDFFSGNVSCGYLYNPEKPLEQLAKEFVEYAEMGAIQSQVEGELRLQM